MQPEEINTLTAIAQVILALAALLASISVSIFVYVGTKRIARMEYDRSIREWWNMLNSVALSSDELLLTADRLWNPASKKSTIPETRRKYLAFLVLNALASSYVGANRGLTTSPRDTVETVKHHLQSLLISDDIYELTQQGYEAEFAALCREIRLEIATG